MIARVQDCADIGPHYAVTLRAWRAAWEREHDSPAAPGLQRALLAQVQVNCGSAQTSCST